MVWRENGKYGFYTSGKTLRSDWSSRQSKRSDIDGVIVKQVRNLALLTTNGIDDFIHENEIDDGIGSLKDLVVSGQWKNSRPRRMRGGEVQFSLGKKKRWLIPETVQEREDERVIVVERRVHGSQSARHRGDCESVYDSRTGCARKPKGLLAHVGDLEPKTEDPYVRYEICKAFPQSTYPRNSRNPNDSCCCYSCCGIYQNPNKSASKNKHFKNKGYRWGYFREHDLLKAPHDPDVIYHGVKGTPKKQDKNGMGKVKVVSAGDLKNQLKNLRRSRSTVFDMGEYISRILLCRASCGEKKPRKKQICNKIKGSLNLREKIVALATKKEATPSENVGSTPAIHPPTFIPEKKISAQVEIIRETSQPEEMKQLWGKLFREGVSCPRKFAIDLNSLISNYHGNVSVLFEDLQENADDRSDVVSLLVSLVDASDLVAVRDSGRLFSEVAVEFARYLKNASGGDRCILHTVKDVVDAAVLVIDKHATEEVLPQKSIAAACIKKPKVAVKAFEMLNAVLGLEMKPTKVDNAILEVKENCVQQDLQSANSVHKRETFCGICFMDFEYDIDDYSGEMSFTTLKACGHSFCNECWKICLKTQIHEGRTPVMCPGHQCKKPVDDVTIMALAPSWYGRYLKLTLNKALEKSPEWTWCPSRSCEMVIKVNSLKTKSGTKGNISTDSASKLPLAISCVCGTTSCQLCHQEAHWPASCSQARQFVSISKVYEVILREEGKDLITSVKVRKCPSCQYPIEKHLGCNFMYCIMCNTSYCWNCLVIMEKHGETYSCKQPAKSSQVVPLPMTIMRSKFNAVIDIAIKNRIARQSGMHKFRQAVRYIQRVLSTFPAKPTTPLSRSMRRKGLSGLASKLNERSSATCSELVTTLQTLADFKYMCHFVLEGTAMAVCARQRKDNREKLHQCMLQLQFITDQINLLVTEQQKKLLLQSGTGLSLQNWCSYGIKCISTIKKLTHS